MCGLQCCVSLLFILCCGGCDFIHNNWQKVSQCVRLALVAHRWHTPKVAAEEGLMRKWTELREANRVLVLIVRSLDQQEQRHLGTC